MLQHVFCGNAKQLQRYDSEYLSSIFTDYSFSSVLVLFAFIVLGFVSSVLYSKRLAGKNVSEMTYFVSSAWDVKP